MESKLEQLLGSPKHAKERKAWVRAILEPYFTAKRDETIISLYERLRPASDGMIRSEMNPTGTSRGRYASAASLTDPESTNLQNLTKKIAEMDSLYRAREVIVPDPGFLLGAADYSGAEALNAAAYMRDWATFDRLLKGEDVHRWTGARIFGKSEDAISKFERQLSKQLRYASTYKASVWKLTHTLNMDANKTGKRFSQSEVRAYWLKLLQVVPLQRWWGEVEAELERENNVLTNALGFTCRFHNPDPDKRLKEALAFYPQSTVASAIDRAFEQAWHELHEPGVFELCLQVHDEILFQCLPEVFRARGERLLEIMQFRFTISGREIYIPADLSMSPKSWGEMEKVA